MTYSLGPVKPHVRAAAETIGRKYGITTVLGWGTRSNASDHPKGLALDFMTTRGGPLAEHVKANAGAYGVTYVIWDQRIWSTGRAGEGWRAMEDRGSPTANHKDHVHVSFSPTAGSGTPTRGTSTGAGSGSTKAPRPKTVPTQTAAYPAAPVSLIDVDKTVNDLLITGAALGLGVVLVLVGAARLTKPALDRATDDGAQLALTAAQFFPAGKATTVAATTAKGAL